MHCPSPDEKASIEQVLEFARRKIVFYDVNSVYVAKHHYQEDRGYTKGDIFLIAEWLGEYIKYLQKGSPIILDFLPLPEKKFLLDSLDFFAKTTLRPMYLLTKEKRWKPF